MSDEQNPDQQGAPSQRVMNEDGSTNWAVLFDDPEQGILVAIRAAKSMKQLRPVMASVAQLLFKRKRDTEPRAEFMAQMGRIMESVETAGFEAVQMRIVGILDAEKKLRIEKAALHAKNKLTQSIERRREGTNEGLLGTIIGNPFLLAGAVAGVLSIIALVLIVLILPSGDPADKKSTEAAESQQTSKTPETASPQPITRPAPSPRLHEAVALKPVPNEVLFKGERRRMALVPLIMIETGAKIGDICALTPWINESVLLNVGAVTEAGRNADASTISEVASKVSAEINSRSSGAKLKRLYLVDIRKLPKKIVLAANRGCERVKYDLKP